MTGSFSFTSDGSGRIVIWRRVGWLPREYTIDLEPGDFVEVVLSTPESGVIYLKLKDVVRLDAGSIASPSLWVSSLKVNGEELLEGNEILVEIDDAGVEPGTLEADVSFDYYAYFGLLKGHVTDGAGTWETDGIDIGEAHVIAQHMRRGYVAYGVFPAAAGGLATKGCADLVVVGDQTFPHETCEGEPEPDISGLVVWEEEQVEGKVCPHSDRGKVTGVWIRSESDVPIHVRIEGGDKLRFIKVIVYVPFQIVKARGSSVEFEMAPHTKAIVWVMKFKGVSAGETSTVRVYPLDGPDAGVESFLTITWSPSACACGR